MFETIRSARHDSGRFERGMHVATKRPGSKTTERGRVIGCTEDEVIVLGNRGSVFTASPDQTIYLGRTSFRSRDLQFIVGTSWGLVYGTMVVALGIGGIAASELVTNPYLAIASIVAGVCVTCLGFMLLILTFAVGTA